MNDKNLREGIEQYTQDALEYQDSVRQTVSKQIRAEKKSTSFLPVMQKVAAVFVFAVAITAFMLFTTPGKALAKTIDESIIQKLFPPKTIGLQIEGQTEPAAHMPHGVEPDESKAAQGKSGYVLYIDESRYRVDFSGAVGTVETRNTFTNQEEEMLREGYRQAGMQEAEIEAELARERDELKRIYESMPPCRMEITQFAGQSPQQLAQQERTKLQEKYKTVGTIESTTVNGLDALQIRSNNGQERDSEYENSYFISNAKGGSFLIRVQYYLQAAEGHASRFHAALQTFEILPD